MTVGLVSAASVSFVSVSLSLPGLRYCTAYGPLLYCAQPASAHLPLQGPKGNSADLVLVASREDPPSWSVGLLACLGLCLLLVSFLFVFFPFLFYSF